MLFVASGVVTYRKASTEHGMSLVTPRSDFKAVFPVDDGWTDAVEEKLAFGDWMCEACLWTEWHYLGRAASNSGATLLCLADEKFMKYAALYKEVSAELLIYSRLFVETLNGLAPEDLTDLPAAMEDLRRPDVDLT